jgi:hypothetical protein
VGGVGVDWERGQFVCIVTLTPPGLERYQDHHLASTGMRQWAVALWLKSSEQPKIQKGIDIFWHIAILGLILEFIHFKKGKK